jgi:hypothetical protein
MHSPLISGNAHVYENYMGERTNIFVVVLEFLIIKKWSEKGMTLARAEDMVSNRSSFKFLVTFKKW